MELYSHSDYRKILRLLLQKERQLGRKITLEEFARAARVQRPYLSKVLNRAADLNADQLFLICRFLRLDAEETEYLGLLLEHERSVARVRKAELQKKITAIQNRHLAIANHVRATKVSPQPDFYARYYLDPLAQLVHLFLTIPAFRADPQRIPETLRISRERLAGILKALDEMGIIAVEGERLKVLMERLHLPKESVLCTPQQLLLRMKALDRLSELGADAYSFSVCFSADDPTRRRIQQGFVDFLEATEALVRDAPGERVYQINFDLLPWS